MTQATAITYPLAVRGAVLRSAGSAAPYVDSRPLTIEDLALEAPGPHEVLVRIEAAGLCHSDLSVINGSRPRPLPMLLGHEAAGIVEDLGPAVDDLERGQRVVMVFLPRCGECAGCSTDGRRPCERGSATNAAGTLLEGGHRITAPGPQVQHHLGVSGFATHAVVDRRSVVPVDADVPAPVAAVLGCALLTGGGAVLNVRRPTPSDSVAVVGLGGVGMAALITARALGVERLVAIDHLPEKLARATELGATEAHTPAEAAERGVSADLVIEAAGHPRAFETAVAATAVGGTMVTVGLPAPGDLSSVEPLGITAGARSIVGSYLGSAVPDRDIPLYVDLWRTGRLDVEALVSASIGLDDVNAAMDSLAAGHAVRQVITF